MSYLTKKNIADVYPLSPMQQGMLFHTLYDPKGVAYFEQFNCIIEGSLNLKYLEEAWNHLIREYPIFRTVYNWKDANQPLQIVLKERPINLEVHDFKDPNEMVQQERINDFLTTDREALFDLARGPLMRLNVLLLDDKKYYFVWSYHHILIDGWCLAIIMEDLFKAYSALQNGKRLPSLNRPPYKNYIVWLDSQDKEKAKRFWGEYLRGFDTPTPLPWDYEQSKKDTLNMTEQVLTLSEDATSRLERFARSRRTTLSTLIQSVWAILLGRYSGHNDIVYGITVSGRPPGLKGSDEIVGLFINTLPVRAIIDENRSYIEFLEMFKDRSSSIMGYEYSFLPDIQACSAVPPGQSLFNSILVFENYPLDAKGFNAGLDLKVNAFTPRETTNYDITVVGMPGRQLSLRILYNQDKFEDSTIRRLMDHMNNLILHLLKSPDEPMININILSRQERKDLLIGFNNTNRDFPKDKCTHELFEEQVDIRPDKVALVFGKEKLTYAQLNEASNKIARYLRVNGVGRGTYVAIMVGRSMDMIIGVLGILKAGGAYVPIEAEYPKARIKYMLEETQSPVIIVHDNLLDRLPEYTGKILSMDQFWKDAETEDGSNLENVNSPEDSAYVIYTSGSTGRPKGVMIPHSGITRLVKNTNYADITPNDSFLQASTFAFDAATLEFWGPLLNGGTLFLASSSDVLSPDSLAELLLTNNITILFLTTVLFNQLIDTRPDSLINLKRLLVGGEVNSVPHFRKCLEYTKPGCFASVYGPTENTTFSTYYDVDHVPDDATRIPIGYPIANSTLYILDERLRPVPIGVPGEIYLGGYGLAQGYLNDPEKTAKAFVPNPISDVNEDRLYKTGDLGKWLPDGSVDFLGRIDTQVKIRGHRIELGEIESVLTDYIEVKDSVVIIKDYRGGNKLIVAYYVAEVELSINSLRYFLKEKVPDYMIPNIFIRLDRLPLNPNGKVDKKALPEPEGLRPEMDTVYRAPSNDIENVIAGIWQDVLGVDKIGIHDNFFDLGGHSIKATQAVTRMKEALDVNLPIRAIFENPTIRELEGIIIELQSKEVRLSSIPELEKQSVYEVSHAQRRLWFLDKLIPNSPSYNIHGDILIEGGLNIDAVTKALQIIVNRHESLRTTFSTRDDKPVQIISDYLKVDLPLIDLTDKPEDKQDIYVEQIIEEEASTPFNLEKGPLFRVKIIRLAPLKHTLLLTMHHIISDGWSMGIILKEATSAYFAAIDSKTPKLPELHIQYKDFAYWQNRLLEYGSLKDQEEYWLKKLGGRLPILDLSTNRSRPPVQTQNGYVHRFRVDSTLTSRLKELSKGHDVTLFMILLGALGVFLNKLTQQDDIIIGSPIAGRGHHDLENLIGFFVNTLALRMDLATDPDFIELLQQVKKTCLDAYANQDYPFDRLIDLLNPVRDTSRTPIFNVMFVLQNATEDFSKGSLGGITFKDVTRDRDIAKFDLTLFVFEVGDHLEMQFEYNTDLFSARTIGRYAGYFCNLLREVVERPYDSISCYEILGVEERVTLLERFNDTEAVYPEGRCIHELIEEQVDRVPDRVSVVCGTRSITYRELERRSNQLANYLRSRGVGPDVLVGIMMDRSIEMVVGILGILKAGGGYVPLDPEYPEVRLEYMIDDSGIRLLLGEEGVKEKLSGYSGESIYLDGPYGNIGLMSDARPECINTSRDLVYVIYTSGSTGQPKGIEIEHRGLANYILWAIRYYGIEGQGSFPLYTSMSFDLTVTSLFVPLVAGERIEVQPTRVDSSTLLEDILNSSCDIMKLTPAHLEILDSITSSKNKGLGGIDRFIVGGEALSPVVMCLLLGRYPGITFYNEYGPAEAVVGCIVYKFSELDLSCTNVPIGKPIANTKVYILDERLNLVPIGVPGEICIASPGVARGYLNKEEMTRKSFVASPFREGERIYRTGDLGRWLSDGNIEFLGRIDHQIKIRGYRIELGEVDAVLSRYEGIRDCVVVDRDYSGNKYLVGYYVADEEIGVSGLRSFLRETLPEFMVPSRFVRMESLPLTPNGKVDRVALPEPEGLRPDMGSEYVAPRNKIEEVIAAVWRKVLGLDKVGIYDNFFDLGGDSIISLQVVSRLKRGGISIQPKDMFEHQCIADLASIVDIKAALVVEQGPVVGVSPLMPIQRWFFEQDLKNYNHFNQSLIFSTSIGFDVGALQRVLQALIDHHDALRVRFRNEDGTYIQEFKPLGEEVSLIVKDVPSNEELKAEADGLQGSLDILKGPVFRVGLYHMEGSDYLVLVGHHLVMDGVSWRILLEDLLVGYDQALKSEEIVLPEKTTSFRDWAILLEEYAKRDDVLKELSYWEKVLPNRVPDIPIDHDLGANDIGSSEVVSVELSKDETRVLLKNAHRAYNTEVNDLLLTALMRLLQDWTGRSEVVFDLEGHGREYVINGVDISRTVGWFTTIFPVSLSIDRNADIGSHIKYAKERLHTIPHKGFNFCVLKYISGRDFSCHVNTGISFNYLGQVPSIAPDESFSLVKMDDVRSVIDRRNKRANLIDVICIVADSRLKLVFIYSKNNHLRKTIESLALKFKDELSQIISHCLDPNNFDVTPSDFKLVEMDQAELDSIYDE